MADGLSQLQREVATMKLQEHRAQLRLLDPPRAVPEECLKRLATATEVLREGVSPFLSDMESELRRDATAATLSNRAQQFRERIPSLQKALGEVLGPCKEPLAQLFRLPEEIASNSEKIAKIQESREAANQSRGQAEARIARESQQCVVPLLEAGSRLENEVIPSLRGISRAYLKYHAVVSDTAALQDKAKDLRKQVEGDERLVRLGSLAEKGDLGLERVLPSTGHVLKEFDLPREDTRTEKYLDIGPGTWIIQYQKRLTVEEKSDVEFRFKPRLSYPPALAAVLQTKFFWMEVKFPSASDQKIAVSRIMQTPQRQQGEIGRIQEGVWRYEVTSREAFDDHSMDATLSVEIPNVKPEPIVRALAFSSKTNWQKSLERVSGVAKSLYEFITVALAVVGLAVTAYGAWKRRALWAWLRSKITGTRRRGA